MKLLVTGGAGFIGSNFIRYWLERYTHDSIVNLDLLTYAGDRATLADVEQRYAVRYEFVRGDIADDQAVSTLVESAKPDILVHFAAESHNSRGVLDPRSFVRTNVLGTQSLLEAARHYGVGRFHQISTCEIYGDLALDVEASFTEDSPPQPRTPYNASKAAADLLVRAYARTYGLPTTISVSANNYGPWQHPEKVIPLFATNALDGKPLPLYRQSQNRREWLHVLDHCRAIDLILRGGGVGETYNVGGGEERTIEQIADEVLAATSRPTTLKTYVDERPGHDRRYLLDHTKLTHQLGWEPQIRFEDGIPSTVAWYRDHRDWWLHKKDQGAVDEFNWSTAATRSKG